jgi:hypothetical protein
MATPDRASADSHAARSASELSCSTASCALVPPSPALRTRTEKPMDAFALEPSVDATLPAPSVNSTAGELERLHTLNRPSPIDTNRRTMRPW